jgi:hypothetical protein
MKSVHYVGDTGRVSLCRMAFLLASVILIALVGGLYLVSFWASATNRTIEKLSAYE